MKRFAFFLLTLILFSCSVSSDEVGQNYVEVLPIESAVVPEEFELGETYEISVQYAMPSTCHIFSDIYFVADHNERTVAIVTAVNPNSACENVTSEHQATFDFEAVETGTYVFKFWQGETSSGEDEYLIIEVPVIE